MGNRYVDGDRNSWLLGGQRVSTVLMADDSLQRPSRRIPEARYNHAHIQHGAQKVGGA